MPVESFKKSLNITSDTAQGLVSDLSYGVLDVLKGATGGVSHAILTIATMVDDLGESVSVLSKTAASGVGNVSKEVANGLGSVVKQVPLVGGASAYLVKGAGKGVYFVVMTVADVVDTMTKVIGKTAKTSGKIIVFTLGKAEDLTEDVVADANKLVAATLNNIKLMPANKTKKGKKGKKSKSKKH